MSETLTSNGYLAEFVPAPSPVSPTAADNCFKEAELWVNEVRNVVGLIDVQLIRDGVSRDLVATPDETVFVFVDKNMMTQRKESRDYIINIQDYRTLATPFTPEKFDIIQEDVGGTRFTYEVGAWNDEPPWKYTGAYRTAYRIHTKLIKEEFI